MENLELKRLEARVKSNIEILNRAKNSLVILNQIANDYGYHIEMSNGELIKNANKQIQPNINQIS